MDRSETRSREERAEEQPEHSDGVLELIDHLLDPPDGSTGEGFVFCGFLCPLSVSTSSRYRRSGNMWTGIRKTSLWRGALASVLPGPLQRPYPVDGVALCWVTGGLLVDHQDDAPGCVMPSPSALGWLCKDASMGQHGSAMRLFNVLSTVQGSTRTYLLEAVSALTGSKGEQWYQKAGR